MKTNTEKKNSLIETGFKSRLLFYSGSFKNAELKKEIKIIARIRYTYVKDALFLKRKDSYAIFISRWISLDERDFVRSVEMAQTGLIFRGQRSSHVAIRRETKGEEDL